MISMFYMLVQTLPSPSPFHQPIEPSKFLLRALCLVFHEAFSRHASLQLRDALPPRRRAVVAAVVTGIAGDALEVFVERVGRIQCQLGAVLAMG